MELSRRSCCFSGVHKLINFYSLALAKGKIMKTLIVKYLPRIPRSHSAKLLDRFQQKIDGLSTIEEIDLIQTPPPFFDREALNYYVRRDYLRQEIGLEGEQRLEPFDALTRQFMGADVVAMAFPMHNFSFPGIVKTYFDAVMLKEHTWTSGPTGYAGLMKEKRAITMSASGGPYLDPPNPWDHLTTLVRTEFQFMGFAEIEPVLAEGMNISEEYKASSLDRCYKQIQEIVDRWYTAESTG
jgi:FMN-dependent NADH-azoreductase